MIANKYTIDEFTLNKYIVQKSIGNEVTVTERAVPEIRLLIMDNYSSHYSVTFFQLFEHQNISLVCLLLDDIHILHLLNVVLFETLAYVCCMEIDEGQQAENTNIN